MVWLGAEVQQIMERAVYDVLCEWNKSYPPSPPPKTRSPALNLQLGGVDITVPAYSRPSMKGGVTRERLF